MKNDCTIQTGGVFLVDDDPAIRALVVAVLQSAGYAVTACSTAEEFLAQPKPAAPACLILDLGLPGMDGAALQSEMRTRGIDIPVIFLSGIVDVAMATKLMKRGAVNLLQKPVTDTDLLAAVQEALSLAAQASARAKTAAVIQHRIDSLTKRELDIVRAIVAGGSNKQMARSMRISERTVEVHRGRVMRKMEADSVANLVMQWTLIYPQDL